MKKLFTFWMVACLAVFLPLCQGCAEDPVADIFTKPGVTAFYTQVSFGEVMLKCGFTGTNFKECGFYYGTTPNLSDKRTLRATSVDGKLAQALLSGLEAGQTYYFQAYVDGGRNVATSDINSFTIGNKMDVNASEFSLNYAETDIQIKVETNLPISVDLGGASWIKETKTKGLETYNKVFHISRNTDVESRSATIIIATKNGEFTKVIPIQQSGGPIDIPDAVFKQYLVENFDKDGDKEIILSEAALITKINVCTDDIESVQGIEFMPNLTELTTTGSGMDENYNGFGKLKKLDVSKNLALTRLWCSYNQLALLNVSKNSSLTLLNCQINQLTSLDVSKNPALTLLMCSFNQLKSLDVSKNSSLTDLNCQINQLTSLDVSKNPALTELNCSLNQLTSLNVSKNSELARLECWSNQLRSLDVSKNSSLWLLECWSNQLESLDVSENSSLSGLKCQYNQLTSIDVSKNPALELLICSYNQLTSLDVSKNSKLARLECWSNQLESLDVSNNASLTYLSCTNNPNLTEIWLKSGQIIVDFLYDTNVATVRYVDAGSGHDNGHEWVDLGLPSGLKWATCNVGASSPSDYGKYYAWGETTTKSEYTWVNYRFRVTGDSYNDVTFSKYNTNNARGTVDNKTRLEMTDDAARANWGGSWRMPTDAEWTELREKCTWTWTTQGGKSGYEVTSKTNGNSIFLPAAGCRYEDSLLYAGSYGYYWSSSLYTSGPCYAWLVLFDSSDVYRRNFYGRFNGFSVRPVTE